MFGSRRRVALLAAVVVVLAVGEVLPGARSVLSPLAGVAVRVEGTIARGVAVVRAPLERMIIGRESAATIVALEQQVRSLGFERAELVALRAENEALKNIVGFSAIDGVESVAARVIGHDPRSPETVLRINRGSRHGVRTGAAVVNPDGGLVGIVADVGDVVSAIKLLRHRGLAIAARVPGKDDAFGLIESQDGLSLTLSQVPKGAELSVGDVVVTNVGRDGVPPGITIGSVLDVRAPEEALWQEASIAPFVIMRTLDVVTVLVAHE